MKRYFTEKPRMADSGSSDSDGSLDLDEEYPDPVIPTAHHRALTPAGERDLVTSSDATPAPAVCDQDTHAEELSRDLVNAITSQTPRQSVDIHAPVGTVKLGPDVHFHFPQSAESSAHPPLLPPIFIGGGGPAEHPSVKFSNGATEEKSKQEKLFEQVTSIVRDFYQPTFIEWRQLHWSSGQRDFCVELVIRQTSAGREAR